MMQLKFDEFGSLVSPDLHDAYIYRIDFGVKRVNFFCRTPDEKEFRLELQGVLHLLGTGVAEQNLLLDVCLEKDEARLLAALRILLPGHVAAQAAYRESQALKVADGHLMLLRFSPSYGGELLVLCEDAMFESGHYK